MKRETTSLKKSRERCVLIMGIYGAGSQSSSEAVIATAPEGYQSVSKWLDSEDCQSESLL